MVVIVGYGSRQVRSGADWRRRRRQDAVFPQIPSGAAETHDSSKNAQFRRETTNRGEDRREGVGKPACVPFAGFRVELSDCMPSPRAKVHVKYSCLPDPCTCSPHPISIPPPCSRVRRFAGDRGEVRRRTRSPFAAGGPRHSVRGAAQSHLTRGHSESRHLCTGSPRRIS